MVRRHHFHSLRLQDLILAGTATAAKDHLHEAYIVAGSRVQAPTAVESLRPYRKCSWVLFETSVGLPLIKTHQTIEPLSRQDVAGVLHAEGPENVFLEILLQ